MSKREGYFRIELDLRLMQQRLRSFGYAIEGLLTALRDEANFRFHLLMAVLVVGLGWFIGLDKVEWLIVIMTIGFVKTAELLNTAMENLCDHITIEQHPMIKKVKDVAAGAVLISAITAAVVGCMIFGPRLIDML